MLSCLVDCLRLVVRVRPPVSVPGRSGQVVGQERVVEVHACDDGIFADGGPQRLPGGGVARGRLRWRQLLG